MQQLFTYWRVFTIIRRVVVTFVVTVLSVFLILFFLLRIPAVQNWAAAKTTAWLSEKLNTEVRVGDVSIDLLDHLIFRDVYVADLQKDTLLFAGKIEVNIGTVNPFAPSVKLKSIGLYHTSVFLHRELPDSTYNFQFIADAFSGNGTSGSNASPSTSSGKSLKLSLNRIDLEDIHFINRDDVSAQLMDVEIGDLQVLINTLNLEDHILAVEKISIEDTRYAMTKMFDTIPSTSEESWDTVHVRLGDWTLETTQLFLENCAFSYFNVNDSTPNNGINFSDMAITNIHLAMSDIQYVGDTIMTRIEHLSCQEKSGFQLDTLYANVIFSPYEATLNGLLLKTPATRITDAFSMSYNTLNDFDRFETDVRMSGNFVKSKIASADIAYFVPSLAKYNAELDLSGRLYGSLDNLKGREVDAMLNQSAGVRGTINIKGLPVIEETFVDLELEPLYANTYGLAEILGTGSLPSNILALGTINYTGRVTGFVYDLVTFGNLTSDQGNVYTDVHFQYNPDTKTSAFTGDFNTTALNLGAIAADEVLFGRLSMAAKVDGTINGDGTAFVDMQSAISSIEFNGYNYTNIRLDGELENDYFKGNFNIDDPNVDMAFNGTIDMQDSIPDYNFTADIKRANLQQLNLYDLPIVFSANAYIDASGTNIDNMQGNISFGDLIVIRDKYIYRLDTMMVNAIQRDDNKILLISSSLIDLKMGGDFTVSALPAAIKDMVSYYTTGNTTPGLPAQQAEYTITVKNADRLAAIFYPDIQVVRNLTVSGSFNSANYAFNTRVRADGFSYQNLAFDTVLMEARTFNNTLQYFARINATHIGKSINFPVMRSEGNFAKNTLAYNFKVGKDVDSNRINLNGEIAFIDSAMLFNILPSEIFFEAEQWDILPNNSLKYENNGIIAQNFTLNSGNKVISLSSASDPTYSTVLKLLIKNIPIGELAEQYVLPGEEISGTLDASYTIGNALQEPSFIGGFEVAGLTLNNVLLGDLRVNTSLIQPSNRLKFNSTLAGTNGFTTDGLYTLGRGDDEDSLKLKAEFKKTRLMVVEPFLRGILSNMAGDIYGNLNVNGPVSALQMEGDLEVKNGGLTVDYLGSHYYFKQIDIDITRNKLILPATTLTDKLNNTATLKGDLTYSNFDNWYFKELRFSSDHILLMETSPKQNPDFYGYAIGEVDCNITGGLDALTIDVNTTPHNGTVVNLPTYGSGNVKKHDFIRFVNKDSALVSATNNQTLNLSIVDVDLKLNATPDAQIKLLINSEGTEYLSGRGFGSLNILANSLGKVEMTGTYKITEGLYDFNFQGLFQRPFTVIPGSTITFNGSPYKAELDLTAEYLAEDIEVSSLTNTDTKEKTDVNVLIDIDGILEAPEISFDLEIAAGSQQNNADLQRRLQEVKADKNELNKQVFGLLITKSFLPQDLTTFNAVGSTANNTMNDFVSSQLTTYFQNVLNDFLKDTEIDIGIDNIQSGSYNYTTEQGKQFEFDLKREITDNLIIKVGTTYYDFATGSQSSTNNLAGDFEVEYLVTTDGRIRVKAFRVSEYDAIIAKNDILTGVGIYYTKDFNTLKELFTRNKKKPG